MPDAALAIAPRPSSTELVVAERPQNFEPHTIAELELFAKFISDSELAPKDYRGKLANCMVAIVMGRELGLSCMQAVQGIAVINGRPSVWGDAMWALIVSHPEFDGFDEAVTDEAATCTLRRIRRGKVSSVTESFTIAEARHAKLLDKDTPWKTYPKRMLMWRARTFACRSLFPDALKGLSSSEEVGDYVTIDATPIASVPAQISAPPAPAAKGDQPKPQEETAKQQTDPDPAITADQVREWNAARKAGGWSTDEARMYLESLNIKRSGEMRASQLPAATTWAASRPRVDAAPATTAAAVKMTDEDRVRSWMVALDIDLFQQQAIVNRNSADGATDWGRIALSLQPDLERAGLL